MRGPELLRQYLDRSKITARELSRKTGVVDETQMSRFLNGKLRPNLAHAHAIEDATGGAVPARAWLDTPSRRIRKAS
jgi:transcriptional regulator with XRE-family HTH domain